MCEAQLCPLPADADQPMVSPTIGEILRQYGPAYPPEVRCTHEPRKLQVMSMLERCRTGELGGRSVSLPDLCEVSRDTSFLRQPALSPLPGHKAKQWLEKQLEKLLPCPYFLVTFTVPQRTATVRPRVST